MNSAVRVNRGLRGLRVHARGAGEVDGDRREGAAVNDRRARSSRGRGHGCPSCLPLPTTTRAPHRVTSRPSRGTSSTLSPTTSATVISDTTTRPSRLRTRQTPRAECTGPVLRVQDVRAVARLALTGRYPFRIGVYQNADIDAGGVPSNFTFCPSCCAAALRRTSSGSGTWVAHARDDADVARIRLLPRLLALLQRLLYAPLPRRGAQRHHRADGPARPRERARDGGPPSAAREFEGVYSSLLFGNVSSRIVRARRAAAPLPAALVPGGTRALSGARSLCARRAVGLKQRTLFGMVAAMDAAVGHVISALRDTKMWSSTLVWFMSDNGATPGRGGGE